MLFEKLDFTDDEETLLRKCTTLRNKLIHCEPDAVQRLVTELLPAFRPQVAMFQFHFPKGGLTPAVVRNAVENRTDGVPVTQTVSRQDGFIGWMMQAGYDGTSGLATKILRATIDIISAKALPPTSVRWVTMLPGMGQNLDAFIEKWAASGAAERANKDMFLAELCGVLGVAPPDPAKGDAEKDTYVFEREARLAHEGGEVTTGRIDLYKQGCFILEAKQASGEGSSKLGKAKRGTPAWHILMKDAFGQALGYARGFDRPEPFIIVCDIGHCFDLYATFDGTWNYHSFPNAQTNRIFLRDLAKHTDTLRRVFEEPLALDPSKHSAKITREVAAHLAELAKKLEDDGHDQELVAQFLMRCLFTMFAEDVGLLPEGIFTKELKEHWVPHPPSFPGGVEQLWRTMNEGGHMFGAVGKILRFNGGLFASPKALKLDKKALVLLLQAAECNWSDVEPAIFGTLLERALDPKERHALGAHFTPRAYVERLVRPTIEGDSMSPQLIQEETPCSVVGPVTREEPPLRSSRPTGKRCCSR